MILSGSLHKVKGVGRDYYYVKDGKRFSFSSTEAMESWMFSGVFECSLDEIESATEVGGVLGYRPGTVVFSLANMSYWYISNKGRHRVSNPNVFRQSNFTRFNVPMVSKKDLEIHTELGEIE